LEPILRRNGDLLFLQWAVFESAFVPLADGRHDEALQRMDAAIEMNRRSGYTPFESFYVAHQAWTQRLAGDLDRAAETGARAVATARTHGHAWWLSTASGIHATTLLELGMRNEAAELLDSVRPAVGESGATAYLARWLCPLAEATGSPTVLVEADRLLRRVTAPAGSAWLSGADAYLTVARAWHQRGDAARAATTVAPLVHAAERVGWADLVRLGERIGS
jgi:hypothetical protein